MAAGGLLLGAAGGFSAAAQASRLGQSISVADDLGFGGGRLIVIAYGVSRARGPFGSSVPASALRQQMDGIVMHHGNPGDALNIVEAAGIRVDLFMTADLNTIGATFGRSGVISLPNSGGANLPFVALGG